MVLATWAPGQTLVPLNKPLSRGCIMIKEVLKCPTDASMGDFYPCGGFFDAKAVFGNI
jgi:hypothetical protein